MHTKEQILRELSFMHKMGVLPKGMVSGIDDQAKYRPSKMTRMWLIGYLLGSKWPNFWLEVQERLGVKKALVAKNCEFMENDSVGDLVEKAMLIGVDFDSVDIS